MDSTKSARAWLFCLVSLVAMCSTGCLRHLVNSRFPPLNTDTQRITAIRESRDGLTQMSRHDVAASVSLPTLQQTVPELLKPIQGLSNIRVALQEQEILITTSFDVVLPISYNGSTIQVRVAGEGTVAGTAYFDAQTKTLRLRPWLCVDGAQSCTFKLNTIQLLGSHPAPKLLVGLIEAAMRVFANNINGAIQTQEIRLDTPLFAKVDPGQFIPPNFVDRVESVPVQVRVVLDRGAVLIDPTGIHAIAKFENVSGDAPTHAVTEAAAPNVASEFAVYKDQFTNVLEADFGHNAVVRWNQDSVLITKLYGAGVLSSAFDTALTQQPSSDPFLLRLEKAVDYAGFDIPSRELHADSAPDLKCEDLAQSISCDFNESCELNKNCDPGWSCPDCSLRWDFWNSVLDCGARVACEADKARFKTQCELEKVTFKGACEARKAAEKLACEADKTARELGCKANQVWLNSWSGAHFADVQGKIEANKAHAVSTVKNVSVTPDLRQLKVRLGVAGDADVVGTFILTPVDAGLLFCQFPFGGQVRFGVDLAPQDLLLQPSLQSATQTDAGLDLNFNLPSQSFTIRTSQPPVTALLLQNPHFVLACYPLATIAAALGLVDVILHQRLPPDLVRDSFSYDTPELPFTIKVPQSSIQLGSRSIRLRPVWDDKSIGFYSNP